MSQACLSWWRKRSARGREKDPSEEELGRGDSPGRLQHHNSVLALEGAGWGKSDVNVWNPTAVRIAVPTASHPTFFNTSIGYPGSESLQSSGEGMKLGTSTGRENRGFTPTSMELGASTGHENRGSTPTSSPECAAHGQNRPCAQQPRRQSPDPELVTVSHLFLNCYTWPNSNLSPFKFY